jgi:hypothetical protein
MHAQPASGVAIHATLHRALDYAALEQPSC